MKRPVSSQSQTPDIADCSEIFGPNDLDTRNQKKQYRICLPCLVISKMDGGVWTMEVFPALETSCAGCTTAQKIIVE